MSGRGDDSAEFPRDPGAPGSAQPLLARLQPPLEEEALALLQKGDSLRQYLDRLIAAAQYPAAFGLLAGTLPLREAIWWACRCIRQAGDPPAGPPTEALAVAERWVVDPTEENRRAAQAAAQAVGGTHPAYCAALAVFLSGGSLAPPGLPVVPPEAGLAARAVNGAALMALVFEKPETAPARAQSYRDLGLAVGSGADRWNQAAAPRATAAARPAPGRVPPRRADGWD
jgi:hypothetical protein